MHWLANGADIRILVLAVSAVTGCDKASDPESPNDMDTRSAVSVVRGQSPEVFSPGVISDERWQWRITFTSNGGTAYYTVSDGFFPIERRSTIMVSHGQEGGMWSAPEVAPFSGTYPDIDPFITPNGRRLYFASIRPVDGVVKPDLDIWMVERTPHGWSKATHLGSEVNSEFDELYPSATADGTLYFASGPFGPTPEADWDLYRAERAGDGFAPREPLTTLNTDLPFDPDNPQADWEFNPEITADGRTLVFTSLRPGGHGSGDLYVSHFRRGEWTPPVNLGPPVNTSNDEFHPTLSRDGRFLYFARTILSPQLVPSDVYRVPTRALGVKLRGGGSGRR